MVDKLEQDVKDAIKLGEYEAFRDDIRKNAIILKMQFDELIKYRFTREEALLLLQSMSMDLLLAVGVEFEEEDE